MAAIFCCTSVLHLMQSNNGIHIALCTRKNCTLFDRGRLNLKNFSSNRSWQDEALSSLYCNLVSCCHGFCAHLSCDHSNLSAQNKTKVSMIP